MLKHLLGILLLTLTLSGCAEPPYTNVDNEALKDLLTQGIPVYDIRTPEEWRQTGVVAGSHKLTFVDANGKGSERFLTRFTAEVKKDDPVVLICHSGSRSGSLARYLTEKLGYTNVYNHTNGISSWIRAGNAVVR